jgi:hypothetical protein
MSDDAVQEYQQLQNESKKAGRWFSALSYGLAVCLFMMATEAVGGRWYWLAGALATMYGGLWSLADFRYYGLRIALLHLPSR